MRRSRATKFDTQGVVKAGLMNEQFDPYHKWFGIPPAEQPPNFYRLLGVALFEGDAEVIENAAEQRMILLRTFQMGLHAAHSQRLLNEVSTARACLLNSPTRAAYDAALRTAHAQPAALAPVDLWPASAPSAAAGGFDPSLAAATAQPRGNATSASAPAAAKSKPGARKASRKPKPPHVEAVKIVGGGLVGLGLGYLVVCFLNPGLDSFHLFTRDVEVAKPAPPAQPAHVAVTPPRPPPRIPNPEPKAPPTKPPAPAVAPLPELPAFPAVVPPTPQVSPPVTPPSVELAPPVATAPPAEAKPVAVPPEAERAEVVGRIADQLAANDAKALLVAAENSKSAPEAYVLIMAARNKAAAEGNCSAAFAAVNQLLAHFQVDALREKTAAIELLKNTCNGKSESEALAQAALDVCTAADLAGDGALAKNMAVIALSAARKSGNDQLVRSATLRLVERAP